MAQTPRYERANVQVAQPGGSRGNAGLIAEAQAKSSLGQRLQSFSEQITGISKGMAQTQGAKDAVVDIQKRKDKVAEIRTKGLSPEQEQAEIAKITEGADRIGIGAYSKAYENSALSAYSSQVTVDAQIASDLAMIESKGNPDTFMAMFREFSNETVRGAPTVHTSFVAQQALLAKGSSGYKSLMMAKLAGGTKANKKSYTDAYDALSKQYSDAYYQQDQISTNQIMAQLAASGEAAIRDGLISRPEYEVKIQSTQHLAVSDQIKRHFGEELNVGNGDIAYGQFIQAERKGAFETFPPDDIAKMKSSMLTQIKEYNDGTLERANYEKKNYEVIADETFRIGQQMVAQNELTEQQIVQWESGKVITVADADNLRERLATGNTLKVSDAKSLSRYAESSVLVDTDNNSILNDPSLSERDKTSLIARRENLLDGKFNWRKTNDGVEATRRIKSKFNIIEGTLMAKIDLDNNTMRDFDKLYKQFYAEASQSQNPADEVLTIADRLLETYDQKKADEAKAKTDARKAQKLEEAKNAAAAYNDRTLVKIGWSDEVTAEEMMLRK